MNEVVCIDPTKYRKTSGFDVTKLQPAMGAEITGVDLTRTISREAAADIRAALNAHRFPDGKPVPSVKTGEDELLALAAGLRDAGKGVFQINQIRSKNSQCCAELPKHPVGHYRLL